MELIELDFVFLKFNKLTVNEYLYLRHLYKPIENVDNIYDYIDTIAEDSLEDKGFIKITEGGIVIRNSGKALFERKELFYTFLSMFPIKTPKGRYLSPAGVEGIAVNKIKSKWDRLFKNKHALQLKVIKVLEAELALRRREGNFEFMSGIEAWLNGANWEKFEYLLDEFKPENNDEEWS